MDEIKYIIVKSQGRLKHYKSNWNHHITIARDNGFESSDIVESGIILDKKLFILECMQEKHLLKHKAQYIGNVLNEYQDNRMKSWLKGRELESMLYYSKKAVGLREGD